MKKILFIILCLLFINYSHAQMTTYDAAASSQLTKLNLSAASTNKTTASTLAKTIATLKELSAMRAQYDKEIKMVEETRKILGLPDLKVTATCVRVPVRMGHAVSVNVELEKPFDLKEVTEAFAKKEGVIVKDDVKNNVYPMPLEAAGKDEVFVGRIRRDDSVENGLNLWVVADNIRKGAATNAVQIAEELIKREIV